MKKLPLKALMEASIFAALAFILDLLPSIKLTPAISISFAMVPVLFVAIRWGVRAGMASGFIWGILQVVFGDVYILTPLQAFIEYFIAFAFVGFAGFWMSVINKAKKRGKGIGFLLILAVLTGSLARYFWHFIAGWIFFGEYAPKGQSAALYSLIVNGGTMLGAAFLCSLVMGLLIKTSPRVLNSPPSSRTSIPN